MKIFCFHDDDIELYYTGSCINFLNHCQSSSLHFSNGCCVFKFYTTVVKFASLNVIDQYSLAILTLIKLEIQLKLDLLDSLVF